MLVLSVHVDGTEAIRINTPLGPVMVRALEVRGGNKVRLGFDAPTEVLIDRVDAETGEPLKRSTSSSSLSTGVAEATLAVTGVCSELVERTDAPAAAGIGWQKVMVYEAGAWNWFEIFTSKAALVNWLSTRLPSELIQVNGRTGTVDDFLRELGQPPLVKLGQGEYERAIHPNDIDGKPVLGTIVDAVA